MTSLGIWKDHFAYEAFVPDGSCCPDGTPMDWPRGNKVSVRALCDGTQLLIATTLPAPSVAVPELSEIAQAASETAPAASPESPVAAEQSGQTQGSRTPEGRKFLQLVDAVELRRGNTGDTDNAPRMMADGHAAAPAAHDPDSSVRFDTRTHQWRDAMGFTTASPRSNAIDPPCSQQPQSMDAIGTATLPAAAQGSQDLVMGATMVAVRPKKRVRKLTRPTLGASPLLGSGAGDVSDEISEARERAQASTALQDAL